MFDFPAHRPIARVRCAPANSAEFVTADLQPLMKAVASDFGLDMSDLQRPTRGSPRQALARQVAMYLCHVVHALTFEAIGRVFGRDRTTVSYACRVVEDRRDDIWFDCRIATLELVCGTNVSLCDEAAA